jgi:hypothetical protein
MRNRRAFPETEFLATELSLAIAAIKPVKKNIGHCSIGLLVYT